MTSMTSSLHREATIASPRWPRRDLCQDTDPRALRNNPVAPETPASYTSTGSPAPVCADVTGPPLILINQRSYRDHLVITPRRNPMIIIARNTAMINTNNPSAHVLG